MKVVVTYLQARRVVLPYLFTRHVLPQMQEMIPGEVELVLIQHRNIPDQADGWLDSARKPSSWGQRVVDWSDGGRFDGATIITHDTWWPLYPHIPGMHLACRAALERDADFHLWIEDDALVWDQQCAQWPERFAAREVGVYRKFSRINSAFFVSRPSFDERILPGLGDLERWTKRNQLEAWLQRHVRTPRASLRARDAVRSHRRTYPYTGDRFVVDLVRRLAPDDLPLLDLELGTGAQHLPPVGQLNRAMLTARDWARPLELARRGLVAIGGSRQDGATGYRR